LYTTDGLLIRLQKSRYKVTGRAVELECYKVGVGEIWPRLTASNQKLGWLRPDFDRFDFDDSDGSSDGEMEVRLSKLFWAHSYHKILGTVEQITGCVVVMESLYV
jgi:hypothetical protein